MQIVPAPHPARGVRVSCVLPSLALSCEYTSNSPQAHIFLHLLRALGCGYKEYIQSTLDYIVLDLFFAVGHCSDRLLVKCENRIEEVTVPAMVRQAVFLVFLLCNFEVGMVQTV